MKTTHTHNNPIKNYILCGLLGWCIEVLFTSHGSLIQGDKKARGTTSLWMFPIYGFACFICPLSKLLKHQNLLTRGCLYATLIMIMEYISGKILTKKEACPWNYSASLYHIQGLVRLDYFPLWFLAGLFYEAFLKRNSAVKLKSPRKKLY